MSLIADALRAAERDRRVSRNARTDTRSPQPVTRVQFRRSPLPPLLVTTMTAVATAGLVIWLRGRGHD